MNQRGYNTIKAKKILAMLLATASLLTVMVTPASAAEKNVPFDTVYVGYNVSGYINLTNYTVTAAFSLTRRSGQAVVQVNSLEITGNVYYYNSKGELVPKSYSNSTSGSLSCRASTTTEIVTSYANATYLIDGEYVKYLNAK